MRKSKIPLSINFALSGPKYVLIISYDEKNHWYNIDGSKSSQTIYAIRDARVDKLKGVRTK